MNKIISIKQKFLCKDCKYILEISRLKSKKSKNNMVVSIAQGVAKKLWIMKIKKV
ncbi:hypothetical protein [Lactococcus cremoris]|uniref:Uncharacterized protein n=1 Tax=Lactococcus lactis subsp. cremoris TaxID=1359 RepID=A0ABR5EJ26_LACLC|nr:hypothetical protein [Lactococcus cremoris]KKW74438.1 hypothetical protein VN93_0606 [Lactococcus cremoris]